MPHALPQLAESLISRGSVSSHSRTALSSREPLRAKTPPHPLLAPLNSLLAALLIPLTLPSLQLATPTLLLSVLEAILETRIEDVPDAWRGSWDRQHRRAVTLVLVRAIGEVAEGLTRRLRVGVTGEVEGADWRPDSVDVEEVVRGREHEVAKLVEALLDIAEALDVVSNRSNAVGTPETPRAQERFLPDRQDPAPPSPAATPTPLSPDTVPLPIEVHRAASPPSPTPRRRTEPPEPTTLFAPRSLRAPRQSRPAPVPSTPPPPPSDPFTPTRSSFLAEVAAHRWRSPPPPVSPLSPRRRQVERAHDGDAVGKEHERRSTLELLRRRLAASQAARAAPTEERSGVRADGMDKGKARALEAERWLETPSEPAQASCEACGASARRQRPARRPPQRVQPSVASSTSEMVSRDASSSSILSTSSSSDIVDTFAESSFRSARTPVGSPLPPCTCTRPPPLHLPAPLAYPKRPPPRPAVSATPSSSSAVPTSSKPRRIRLTRAHPPPSHGTAHHRAAEDSPSAAELSLHSSTDIDAHEQSLPRRPPTASGPTSAVGTPPPAAAPLREESTPSPYTLLLLAHRARLREKLALLERRERDRREAARVVRVPRKETEVWGLLDEGWAAGRRKLRVDYLGGWMDGGRSR